jgi:mRNA-degrading endonuclease RelE of RelBE toxin-antitoxin system
LTFDVAIEQGLVEKINNFDEKSRRIIQAKLVTLSESPYPGKRGDKEKFCLKDGFILYRLHIGRTWTAFYRIYDENKSVKILDVMTIEQAHKKYGHFRSFSQ